MARLGPAPEVHVIARFSRRKAARYAVVSLIYVCLFAAVTALAAYKP